MNQTHKLAAATRRGISLWGVLFLAIICMAALPFPALAQGGAGIIVTGTVTDEAGQPVIGAAVFVRGSSVGTTADLDGK